MGRCPAASRRPGSRSPIDPFVAAELSVILLGNARLRQANEFGKWRVRPAGSARQRWGKSGDGRTAVPVERPQVDIASGAAGRAARPQEPIAGRDGGADRGREQHRHPLGLRRARRVFPPRTRGDTATRAAGANASVAYFFVGDKRVQGWSGAVGNFDAANGLCNFRV